jgi:Tol biopolymer transport system component
MKDDNGITRIFAVSPNGGKLRRLTYNLWNVASAFSWSPDGRQITYVMDNSVFVTDVDTGNNRRLTPRSPDATAPRPEACVFSPDGNSIAYVRQIPSGSKMHNQIFVVGVN